MGTPKKFILSIIITADIETKELNRALNSLCEQNCDLVEIICLNNGFNKGALEQIYYYQSYSSNFRLLDVLQCKNIKKYACQHSTGKYILFLDPNTIFESNKLTELCNLLDTQKPDICQLKMELVDYHSLGKQEISLCQNRLKMYGGVLFDEQILKKVYLEKIFSDIIYNKIIKKEILYKCWEKNGLDFTDFENNIDDVIFFKVVCFSQKYYGACDSIWAKYVVNSSNKDLFLYFKSLITSVNIYIKMVAFLQNHNEHSTILKRTSKAIWNSYLIKVLNMWVYGEFDNSQKISGLEFLCKYWGEKLLVLALSQWYRASLIEYSRFIVMLIKKRQSLKKDIQNKYIGIVGEETIQIGIWKNKKFHKMKEIIFNEERKPQDFLYEKRWEEISKNILEINCPICVFESKNKNIFWDITSLSSRGVVCILDLRENLDLEHKSLAEYYEIKVLMNLSDIVIISSETDGNLFDENKIKYAYDYENAINNLNSLKDLKRYDFAMCSDIDLLNRIYYKKNIHLLRENNDYKQMIGPYFQSILRLHAQKKIKKGIKYILLWEVFSQSTFSGKINIVLKLLKKLGKSQSSIGLQNNSFDLTGGKIGFYLNLLKKNPIKFVNKLYLRYTQRAFFEKHLSLGNENPDKIFYTIRMNPYGNEGLLLSYLRILRELRDIEKSSYIPVIDMQWAYYVMAHNSKDERQKVNAWELYFQPVTEYTLKSIKKSSHVIRGKLCYREQEDNFFRSNLLRSNDELSQKDYEIWCKINKKYMKLQPRLIELFEKEYEQLIGKKRVIGVIIREGYAYLNQLNYELIGNHPVQPLLQDVIHDLKSLLEKWMCEYIFVSAEYEQTINDMKKAFGKRLIYTKRFRKSFETNSVAEYQEKRTEYYKKISREEINIDYLKEVYLLSKCTNLLCGRCSASLVALLWNCGKYEHYHIYELGKYHTDNTKERVSLSSKQ